VGGLSAVVAHRAIADSSSPTCTPLLYQDGDPRAVVVLADGISSSIAPGGSYTPADVGGTGWGGVQGGYCSAYHSGDANPASFVSGAHAKPAGLDSIYKGWANALAVGYQPQDDEGTLLTDVLGSAGAAIVPYSYGGAVLSLPSGRQHPQDAVITVAAAGPADPGKIVPAKAAQGLNREIQSIHHVWPKSQILVVGHSEGGLVVEDWWSAHVHDLASDHVFSLFALDAPLNGVSNAVICEHACGAFQIDPPVARVWASLWKADQSKRDGQLIHEDEVTGDRFFAVGTDGDPVYALGDYPNNNGLGSQLLHTGVCIGDAILCNYSNPVDVMSGCPTSLGFGAIGFAGTHLNVLPGHGLVMNCASVETLIRTRLLAAIGKRPSPRPLPRPPTIPPPTALPPATTTTTTTTTTTAPPAPQGPSGPGYAAALQQWEESLNSPAAFSNQYQMQAASDLQSGLSTDTGNTSGYQTAIAQLTELASIPITSLTPEQMAEGEALTAALDTFFNTPGLQ